VLVHDDAADVLTIHKILVAVVNFVQCVLVGSEFRELGVTIAPPKSRASRRHELGSGAKTCPAPACLAPWTALTPTPSARVFMLRLRGWDLP
jgi:hypothetical protein